MQDLSSYSLDVIAPVLERFGGEVPEEYKPLWPAVGVFMEMMRGHVRAKRPSEPTSGERWAAHVDEFWKQPPAPLDAELQAKVDALNEKYELKKPKEIYLPQYNEVLCPHCSELLPLATNMRLWTAEEMHAVANTLEELAVIAQRNRDMPKLPLGDVVDEVTHEA